MVTRTPALATTPLGDTRAPVARDNAATARGNTYRRTLFTCWVSLPAAVRILTLNARAVGLTDRGAIQRGLRADLIVVDLDEAGFPHVRASLLDGRRVFVYHPASAAPVLATV